MSAQDILGACPVCGAPCYECPSGVVCTNGHGGVEPVAPGGLPERCPGCGAAFVDTLPMDGALYECGTIASPGRVARSRACELLEESVEVIHQLQGELEVLTTPPAVTHQSVENALPVRAYFPSCPPVPESLQKLRAKAEVYLEMATRRLTW